MRDYIIEILVIPFLFAEKSIHQRIYPSYQNRCPQVRQKTLFSKAPGTARPNRPIERNQKKM